MQNATTEINLHTFKPVSQLYLNITWKQPHKNSNAAKPSM